MDLSDVEAVRGAVRSSVPNIIVNAAAYTAVDRAEREQAAARAVNTVAPAILAEEAKRLGALLVHYSTDYVYDGEARAPMPEHWATGPLNTYGLTKLEGDIAIQQSGAAHLIFRTSWVYGLRGHNFLRTMLRLGRERPELSVVDDQIGAPTWSRSIAQATAQVLTQGREPLREHSGVYHLTAAGQTSWHGFATAIFSHPCVESRPEMLRRISSAEYPTPAERPAYSVLSTEKVESTFGVFMCDWRDELEAVLREGPLGESSYVGGPFPISPALTAQAPDGSNPQSPQCGRTRERTPWKGA
jgi:dTDP-4-dehydrorhamnose reductase